MTRDSREVREQGTARAIRERTIQGEIRSRIHQGMDDEQADAVEAEVRAELADEPLPTPGRPQDIGHAARHALGRPFTDFDWRREESYQLAVALGRFR